MEIWIDKNTNEIKAIYKNCKTKSNVWKDRGYIKYDRIKPFMLEMDTSEVLEIEPGIFISEKGIKWKWDGNKMVVIQ